MYAVIFRAEINELDETYFEIAARLRDLALSSYGCIEFTSAMEGKEEIAISYWENEAQILDWKQDPQHLAAQQLAHTRWYKSYRVEIVKIEREYSSELKWVKH